MSRLFAMWMEATEMTTEEVKYKYYRSLNWWVCGWCSLLHWEFVLWQQDSYGNTFVVNRKTLRVFNGFVDGYEGGDDDQ